MPEKITQNQSTLETSGLDIPSLCPFPPLCPCPCRCHCPSPSLKRCCSHPALVNQVPGLKACIRTLSFFMKERMQLTLGTESINTQDPESKFDSFISVLVTLYIAMMKHHEQKAS